MIADDIKAFAFALGRAQAATAQAAHDARGPEIDRLRALVRDLVQQMEDAVDLDKPSFARASCRECTHGTTPDHLHAGPCAYHRALAIAKAAP